MTGGRGGSTEIGDRASGREEDKGRDGGRGRGGRRGCQNKSGWPRRAPPRCLLIGEQVEWEESGR